MAEELEGVAETYSSGSSAMSASWWAGAGAEEQGHGWEVVATSAHGDDGCSIFPPSRHEGLRPDPEPISSPTPCRRDQELERSLTQRSSSPRRAAEEEEKGEDEVTQVWRRSVSDSARRVVESGLEFVRSKLSVLRGGGGGNYVGGEGAILSFAALAGVVGAILYVRRRHRREKELLLLLIQEKDQRICQLLNQVAQMNELLAIRYQIPVSKRI